MLLRGEESIAGLAWEVAVWGSSGQAVFGMQALLDRNPLQGGVAAAAPGH